MRKYRNKENEQQLSEINYLNEIIDENSRKIFLLRYIKLYLLLDKISRIGHL